MSSSVNADRVEVLGDAGEAGARVLTPEALAERLTAEHGPEVRHLRPE
jgi:hypothetical protein